MVHPWLVAWMESLYVPLSKSGEKLRAHKIITGGPRTPVLDKGFLCLVGGKKPQELEFFFLSETF